MLVIVNAYWNLGCKITSAASELKIICTYVFLQPYFYVSFLQVCHATHDVTYSKHGSFFCDCGAKEDGSCQALVKRSSSAMMSERPSMTSTASNLGYEPMLPSSLRIRPTSPTGLTNLNKTLTGGDLDSKPVNIFRINI